MKEFSDIKRIVVKIGSSSLTHSGGGINFRKIDRIAMVLSDIKNMGKEVILVTSGAVGAGMAKLGMRERPRIMEEKQAAASVGQCELMYMYDKFFADYSIVVAQVLLTKYVLLEDRRQHVVNSMERLLSQGVIPIVNENDTVAIDELELEVGENDSLAANVATIANADLLVIMSDIDGLYDKDPHVHENANLIPEVGEITDDIRSLAGGAGSALGTGGMATKIKAVEIAHAADIDVVLMNGKNPHKLYDLFEDQPVGTLFAKKK